MRNVPPKLGKTWENVFELMSFAEPHKSLSALLVVESSSSALATVLSTHFERDPAFAYIGLKSNARNG